MEQTEKKKRLSAISESVKIWRKQRGLTQAKAAELTGINISQYQRLERGTDVNLSTFLAVWDAINFTLSGTDVFPLMESYAIKRNIPIGLDGIQIKKIKDMMD